MSDGMDGSEEHFKAQAAFDALLEIQEDVKLIQVIVEILKHKPQICPEVCQAMCPDLTYAPTRAITERRATGVVKAVNASGGYGFISCPDIAQVFGSDVFAHAKQIARFSPGTNVSFAILLNKDRRPQAFDIEEIQLGVQASRPNGTKGKGVLVPVPGDVGKGAISKGVKGDAASAVAAVGNGEVPGCLGIIRTFSLEKGFGFLEVPTIAGRPGGHVFLHRNHLGQFGLGSIVKCTVYSYEDKAQAKNLEEASALESTECLEQVAAAAAAAATPGDTSGTAPGNAPGSAPQNAPDIELGRFSGTVHKWSDQRGFGFIECADLREQGHGAVFIHQKFINGFKVGDVVWFNAFLHRGKALQAKDLTRCEEPAWKVPRCRAPPKDVGPI